MRRIAQNIMLLFFGIFLAAILMEILLRLIGHKPGIIERSHLRDTTIPTYLTKEFQTDSLGIFKLSGYGINAIRQAYMMNSSLNTEDGELNKMIQHARSWYDLTGLHFYVDQILSERSFGTDTEALGLINRYRKEVVNDAGFRSIPLYPVYDGPASKLMFIGDSFTWGWFAYPLNESFVDLFMQHGILAYNFGVPSADPVQYRAIFKAYADIVAPDVVVFCFFQGDDFGLTPEGELVMIDRPISKDHPYTYATNKGFFTSNYLNKWNSFEDIRDLIDNGVSLSLSDSKSERFMAKSSLLTLIWKQFNTKMHTKNMQDEVPIIDYCNELSDIAALSGIQCVFAVIPANMNLPWLKGNEYVPTLEHLRKELSAFNTFIPEAIVEEYYTPGDDHFNTEGHQLYFKLLHNWMIEHGYIESENLSQE